MMFRHRELNNSPNNRLPTGFNIRKTLPEGKPASDPYFWANVSDKEALCQITLAWRSLFVG
jgi:hypothetical protein